MPAPPLLTRDEAAVVSLALAPFLSSVRARAAKSRNPDTLAECRRHTQLALSVLAKVFPPE
jgi:hypothetical protein